MNGEKRNKSNKYIPMAKANAFIRSGSTVLSMLILLALQCAAIHCFAQSRADNTRPAVRLGNTKTDNNMRLKVTKEQIMENPNIVSTLDGWKVDDFTISFAPKGENIYGPYKTPGARIKDEQLQLLKNMKNTEIKIFVENVHLSNNGKTTTTKPLILICTP